MRLWSINPRYLDTRGLVAAWREGLLAQSVLRGETVGYRNHPQLIRFHEHSDGLFAISVYLTGIWHASRVRGFHFDRHKISELPSDEITLEVTDGQLLYEFTHLLSKLAQRDPVRHASLRDTKPDEISPHPLFVRVSGDIASWEKVSDTANTFEGRI